jgi:hypothetical protein
MLKRPGDGLYVEWNRDLGAHQFWQDGKSATLYNPAMPFYASYTRLPYLENMLEQLVTKIGFCAHLAPDRAASVYSAVYGMRATGHPVHRDRSICPADSSRSFCAAAPDLAAEVRRADPCSLRAS